MRNKKKQRRIKCIVSKRMYDCFGTKKKKKKSLFELSAGI